jgi:UMF1 family MFS transporter
LLPKRLPVDNAAAMNEPRHPAATRREVFAWAMYDWANSAYSTLSITVLVSYMQGALLPGETGVRVWGWGIGLTELVVAVSSPVLGAVADAHGNKRFWLGLTALSGATAASAMFFATPAHPWRIVPLFLAAHLGYELSHGFYNAFLPEIADEGQMGRVSASGYALGYVGGGLALLCFLLLYRYGGALGLPETNYLRPRLGLLMMGLWWGVFTLPALFWLRDRGVPRSNHSLAATAGQALGRVGHTLRNIRAYRMLFLFLLAFLLYNDGIQTVISQASVFAQKVLAMEADELALVVLMIQFLALPGAMLIGWAADRFGQKPALLACLVVWIGLLTAAYFVQTKAQFWCLGAVLALVMGGSQSVSRAIMGLMTPPAHTAEFFGFFNFSGKATSVFGPILFAEVLAQTGSPHRAILSLLAFFVFGALLASRVDVARGQREAKSAPATGGTAA